MKKLFEFKTKTIVATGLGARFIHSAVYVCEDSDRNSGIPTSRPHTASAHFFAALFGPIAGVLIAFIGHALSDSIQYGSAWWSWVVASGLSCFIIGLVYPKLHVEDGEFGKKDIILFNVYQIIGNAIAWIIVAPILDIRDLCGAGKPGIYTGRRSCHQQCDFLRRHRYHPAGALQQDTFQEGQPDKGINQYKRAAVCRQSLQAAASFITAHMVFSRLWV